MSTRTRTAGAKAPARGLRNRDTNNLDPSRRIKSQSAIAPWLFVLPAVVLTLVFSYWPFLNTIFLSFTDSTMLKKGSFVGLDSYKEVLSDPMLRDALINSTIYAVCMAPAMVILPLILAVLVNKKTKIMSFFRASFYIPAVAGSVISGLIFTNLLSTKGLVNAVFQSLKWISTPIPFLQDRWLLLFSAMLITVWGGLGYYMVIYLAALANIDVSLYEAASIDGAGPIRQFLSVTMPGCRMTMVLILLLSSVAAFRVFNEVYILTGGTGGIGGKDITMTMLIMREGTGLTARTGYASALSIIMFFILGILTAVEFYFQNKGDK